MSNSLKPFYAISALLIGATSLNAQQPPPPAPLAVPANGAPAGVEELTRGPVHEAFGRPLVFDPKPGPIAPKVPPAAIEEVPPDEKPAGDNVVWISGYWAWDDDQKRFVWVSGFWRDLPPGQAWVPGYWSRTDNGAQWVSGYWSAAGASGEGADVQYLPEPPESLEAGPPGAAPADDQIWVPGLWTWQTNRYAWRPGYWATGYADWVWTPAHYQWSPLGYAYTPGFWDYPLWRRGLLFAPVAFDAGATVATFTPRLTLNTFYLGYDMFVRPQTGSYYFGNYYASNYLLGGYYPWFSYHNTRFGYDPLFAHTDWVYGRQNIDWEARLRQVYYERRDQPAARPAMTYRDYVRSAGARGDAALVRPLAELQTARDLPFKMERVDPTRVGQLRQTVRAEREFGAQRAQLEGQRLTQLRGTAIGTAREPVTVRLPAAPRFAGAKAEGATSATRIPALPRQPQPDMSRTSGYRPAQPQVPAPKPAPAPAPGQPAPKIENRPPQPQPAPTLPHPEQVLHPDYNRRAVPALTPAVRPNPPAQPPVHQNPPAAPAAPPATRPIPPAQAPVHVAPPPVAPHVLPPINGAPHPGHTPPPTKRPP